MNNALCEVMECQKESDYGWTYLGVLSCPKKQVCSHHWGLHANRRLKWNLFTEFGYPKPPVRNPQLLTIRLRAEQDETEMGQDETEIVPVYSDVLCECGEQKLRRAIYCSECADKKRKESSIKSTKKYRGLQKV